MTNEPETLTYDSREKWLADGANWLGASESGVLFGVHGYHTLRSLWWGKRNAATEPEDEENEVADLGLFLEPYIGKQFEKATGRILGKQQGFRRLVDTKRRIACTLDDKITDGSPVEFKTAWNDQARIWDRLVPYGYQCQLQTQLAVTGAKIGYFAALLFLGGPPVFRLHPMERDEELIAEIYKRAAIFWRYVDEGIAPPVDHTKITARCLAQQYSKTSDESIDFPAEWVAAIERYQSDKMTIADCERRMGLTENRVRDYLGNFTVGKFIDGQKATWRADKNGKRSLKMPKARKESYVNA